MPPVLKVNGTDLSAFLRVQPDDGLDVTDNEYLQPQFGGAPALAEGGIFVANTSRNKQWEVPLWVRSQATGAQGVNDLVKTINNDVLDRGPAALEFRPEGATSSTFFDLEAGRLDPVFSHFHHRKGWAKTDMKLWTKPYGHTATMRTIVASTVSSGMLGPGLYQLSGIQGDARALANVYLKPQNFGLGATGFVMYAVTPLPSYTPFIPMPSVFGSTTVSSGSAIASSYRKYAAQNGIDLAGIRPAVATIALPPGGYAGRNRVYIIAGHSFSGPGGSGVQLALTDGGSQILTQGTALIRNSLAATGSFELVDVGEITVPSQVAGAAPVPTACFTLIYGHNYPTYPATYALRINGAIIQPLDHAAGLVVTTGPNGSNNFAVRSWPQREVYLNQYSGASGMGPSGMVQRTILGDFRGDTPKLPVGSQSWFMAWGCDFGFENRLNNAVATVALQVDVLERFRFLR